MSNNEYGITESKVTKSMKRKYYFYQVLSILVTVAPLLVYIVIGFANGDIHKGQKVFLGFTCIMAAILVTINTLMKYHLRSPLFILLLGVYYALTNILPLIVIIAVGTIIDEFLFAPKAKKYKLKMQMNKEIDNRGIGDTV